MLFLLGDVASERTVRCASFSYNPSRCKAAVFKPMLRVAFCGAFAMAVTAAISALVGAVV
jgi:hypothetical protein